MTDNDSDYDEEYTEGINRNKSTGSLFNTDLFGTGAVNVDGGPVMPTEVCNRQETNRNKTTQSNNRTTNVFITSTPSLSF